MASSPPPDRHYMKTIKTHKHLKYMIKSENLSNCYTERQHTDVTTDVMLIVVRTARKSSPYLSELSLSRMTSQLQI